MEKQALSDPNRRGPILFFNPYFKSMFNGRRLLPPLPPRRPNLLSKMKNSSKGFDLARLQCRRHSRQELRSTISYFGYDGGEKQGRFGIERDRRLDFLAGILQLGSLTETGAKLDLPAARFRDDRFRGRSDG
ncbi:unnamed protein product [Linum trigynum]|uniref:Uncharacterized protein n=1 Tax=Linum trigynum TaxID=586398 RepID=A0AAV2GD03_9ROSI